MPVPLRSLNDILKRASNIFYTRYKTFVNIRKVENYYAKILSKLGRDLGRDEGLFVQSGASDDIDNTKGYSLIALTQEIDVEDVSDTTGRSGKFRADQALNLGEGIVYHSRVTKDMLDTEIPSSEKLFVNDDSDIFYYTYITNDFTDNTPTKGTVCVGHVSEFTRNPTSKTWTSLEYGFGTYRASTNDGNGYLNRIITSGEPIDIKSSIELAGDMLLENQGFNARDGSGSFLPDTGFPYDSDDFPIRMALKVSLTNKATE